MSGITPPVVTLSAGSRTVDIDTGELLFPGLVLAFCLVYYWDTHALPDLSMLYAGPLLYTTAALAVVTLLGQAISVDESMDERDPDSRTTSSEPFFSVRSAALLAVATAAYIVALDPIGFLPATIGYLALTLYLFGERSPLRLAVYSIGFAIVVWLVFIQWLMVPL